MVLMVQLQNTPLFYAYLGESFFFFFFSTPYPNCLGLRLQMFKEQG